jgi:hypothetical protein
MIVFKLFGIWSKDNNPKRGNGAAEGRGEGLVPTGFREIEHGQAENRQHDFGVGNIGREQQAEDEGRQGENERVGIAQAFAKVGQLLGEQIGESGVEAHGVESFQVISGCGMIVLTTIPAV